MITVSLCMIVKNEEEVLARCIDSINGFADEIIIVDTGSIDNTKVIAKDYTSKIYDFEWNDDFSAARNYAFEKATQQYIMWLDADDIVEKEQLVKLLEFKEKCNNSVDVYMLKYNIMFDENNYPTFSYFRERIVKNHKGFKWTDPIHEVLVTNGKVEYLDISISHKKLKTNEFQRNLKIYEKFISKGNVLNARQKFYYSRELFFNNKIDKALKSFTEYFTNYEGWLENKIDATITLSKCYLFKNEPDKALSSLFSSFIYDLPRAEVLCEIGNIFILKNKIEQAIYWFKQALKCKINLESGGFVNLDCYKFIPYIELCVCYFKLNNIKKSIYYNNLAYKIKPLNHSVLHNKNYFKNLRQKLSKTV